MTTASETITERLGDLEDRNALIDLVTRLYAVLDEERFDELDTVYTEDATLDFPSGRMEGLDAVTAMARRRAERYRGRQHVSTDLDIEIDGDNARLRTNHLAFHVHGDAPDVHFDAGIVHRFDAVRTPRGWRLARGEAEVVWTSGTGA